MELAQGRVKGTEGERSSPGLQTSAPHAKEKVAAWEGLQAGQLRLSIPCTRQSHPGIWQKSQKMPTVTSV